MHNQDTNKHKLQHIGHSTYTPIHCEYQKHTGWCRDILQMFVATGNMTAVCTSDGISPNGTWTPDPATSVCIGKI